MEKTEIIAGTWKFRHIDSMNWQVFELREIGENNDPKKNKRSGETEWMPLPNYFGSLLPAIVKAKQLNRERKLPSCGLEEAVEQIREIDAKFEKAIRKALKEAGL